ncbi:MAG TPA: RHS repeat-associated core domain-containing protein, partial [Thermoanaerobaculia bacterium]|nr:RHS repeat-associated core domain-containing protein [Thermoanaerobaculia bacterium]
NNARGITSIGEGGRDSFRIEYDTPSLGQTRVTHARGGVEQISVYTFDVVGGQVAPTSVDGVCSSCGLTTDTLAVTYDDEGRPIAETDGEGYVTRSTYDEASNLTSRTEAAGTPLERTTTFAYEDPEWPSFVTMTAAPAPDGGTRTRRQSWNATHTVLTATDSDGTTTHTTVSTFDSRHRLIRRDGPRTDVEDVTTYTYYADDDAEPNRRGRLSRVANPAGHATTYDRYDLYGTARLIIDPNGVRSEQETDALGRIITITDLPVDGDPAEAEAYVTRFVYDHNDNVVERGLAGGGRVRFAYEKGTDRLTDTILVDRDGAEVERRHLTLNAAGDVVRVEEQSCDAPTPVCAAWTTRRSESYLYDAKGRLSETHRATPAGAKIVYAYDRNGKLISVQDETHSTPNRRYAYDALGRLVLESEMGLETRYGYDVQDNLVSITDRNGGVSTFLYDPFGRLREERSPDSGRTTHGYDESGNRVLSTDANGVTTARTFDSLGRRLTATYSRPDETTESVSWTWDEPALGRYGIGRLTAMTDDTGTTSYAYERRGLLRADGTVTFTYDADGNRRSIGYPSGTTVTYGHDPWRRPTSASAGGTPLVTSVSYLPFGPPNEIAYGNGTRQRAGYDARYQFSSNRLDGPTGAIARYDYTRDAAGRVMEILDALDPSYDRHFAYDDLGRLIGATSGAALWSSATYAYDAMGNVGSTRVGSRRAELRYEGTSSRVKSADEGTAPRAVQHDPAGNELTDGNLVRGYSLRNLMTSVEQEDTGRRIEYSYDGRGIRVATREFTLVTLPRPRRPSSPDLPTDEWSEVTRTRIGERHYVYSPEFRLLGMRTGAIWTDFVWLGSIPVAQFEDGALPRFTFADHLGTPLLQTDPSARLIWRVESEPFGNTWSMRAGRAGDQPLRFPGQELAQTFGGTEERYNIFRWYRSGWGRYTQADPMGALWGDRQLSLYGYAFNDPIGATDPWGLIAGPMTKCPFESWWKPKPKPDDPPKQPPGNQLPPIWTPPGLPPPPPPGWHPPQLLPPIPPFR